MSLDLTNVSYAYDCGTSFEKVALKDVSLSIADGSFVGIAGSSGSGKTTLVRLLKGLIRPSSGVIKSSFDASSIGLVFQYPEFQLFEATVLKDVMFGPRNIGMGEDEAKEAAVEALTLLGLDESFYDRDPLCLSGGEKRRVAIAGILAMRPDVLILDEPTAGLDGAMHDQLFSVLKQLNLSGKTIILVSHNMDDIALYCQQVVVLKDGQVEFCKDVSTSGLPTTFNEISSKLRSKGLTIPDGICSLDEMETNLRRLLGCAIQ
jgi:energy-coupling factor transport system ATP-binding protein